MTISDELHQAAAYIREVAGKASQAPWRFYPEADVDGGPVVSDGTYELAQPGQDEDGDHIALWDPDVAELVADVLDNVGRGLEHPETAIGDRAEATYRREIALARAINAKVVIHA